MNPVLRILDANANRTREALRVMEEAARFILDDAALAGAIKQLRHDFALAIIACEACNSMTAYRNTPGDVGTRFTTPAELSRENVAHVVIAAGKRLSEALRAMEEYAKTLGPSGILLAGQVKAMRYRGYQLEQQLAAVMQPSRARQWRLCVLISECLCPGKDWLTVARAAIHGGADCIQLREKELEAGAFLNRAVELVKLCRPMHVDVIINDRPDIALLAGAQGVHLGQDDLPCAQVRKLVGGEMIIGVSTSHLEQAMQARRDGADYCGVGPMFNTTTKHKDVIVGPDYLRDYLAWNQLPHLAIGGINPKNIDGLVQIGVRGVAVSSVICAAANPAQAAADLLIKLP